MGLRIVNGVPYFDGDSTFGNGTRACSKCMRRPARPKASPRGRQQSYCRQCATEAMRQSRAGKISTLLTPDERQLVTVARELGVAAELRAVLDEVAAAAPAGRHHARALR